MLNKAIHVLLFFGSLLIMTACQQEGSSNDQSAEEKKIYQRIVSLSGPITETLFTLGQGDKVVGIDVTSTYPADQLAHIPRLGHVRNLNVEGVLSVQPDLILVDKEDASRPAIVQLKESNVEVLEIEQVNRLDNGLQIAGVLAERLGGEAQLVAIKSQLDQQKKELEQLVASSEDKPRVLFIYARGAGNMMVAGRNTPAAAMIELAGGVNAVQEFEDFQALSAEGLIQAQPDVLLMFESGLKSLGGEEQVFSISGMQKTPAGQNRRVVAMDGLYLLGFTPRAGSAAIELAKELGSIQETAMQTSQPTE
jgi:iron complex transport system substrate-binding protein